MVQEAVHGYRPQVERTALDLGYAPRQTAATGMVFVNVDSVFGVLLGLLSVTAGSAPRSATRSPTPSGTSCGRREERSAWS